MNRIQYTLRKVRFKHPQFCLIQRLIYTSTTKFADVRVRFAPSPTGQLHLGGLRTALYNYLYAQSNNGVFILRIEDTDQSRVVPGATEKLIDMLQWSGITIDEGPVNNGNYGPYVQSLRLHHYEEMIKLLLEEGYAYHCFCTPRRLELLRKDALRRRETPKYDNKCRHLSQEEVEEKLTNNTAYCVRFKLETMIEPWYDIIYGAISHDVAQVEGDPILMKSDGFPTYHFANVVDDHLMRITHVLRGLEWQVSTAKHILLYRAFGWKPPKFGHLPLLLNKDGSKLSKRQNDVHVEKLRNTGYFPDTVLNLLCSHGSGFGGIDTTGFNIHQLCQHFNINGMNTNSTKVDLEKLKDFNHLHLQKYIDNNQEMLKLITSLRRKVFNKYPQLYKDRMDNKEASQEMLTDTSLEMLIRWASKERIGIIDDLLERNFEFLWILPDKDKIKKIESPCDSLTPSDVLKDTVKLVQNIDSDLYLQKDIANELKLYAKRAKIKYGAYMKFLRSSISGLNEGPPVAEMMYIIGKQNTLKRLHIGLDYIGS